MKRQIFAIVLFLVCVASMTTIAYRLVNNDWVLYRKAMKLVSKGEYEKAIPIYTYLSQKGFRDMETRWRLGETYEKNRDVTAAIAIFEKVAELNPGNINLKFKLAELYTKKGDHRGAADVYSRILNLEPGNRRTQILLAREFTTLGRFDDAIALYKNALGEK